MNDFVILLNSSNNLNHFLRSYQLIALYMFEFLS